MVDSMDLILKIDALLPQTQCGQCGYPGCLPYAEAIAQGTPINQCPPGGNRTIKKLAHLLRREIIPLNPVHGEISTTRKIAFIREAECIGCTKCIQACPVDAILGAAKKMHTVIVDECTGCDLCLEPCPVDCIDMIPAPADPPEQEETAALARANYWRKRFQLHNQRLAQEREIKAQRRQQRLTAVISPTITELNDPQRLSPQKKMQQAKSAYIMALKQWKDAEAALQHLIKRTTPSAEQQTQIAQYQQQVEQLKRAAENAKQVLDAEKTKQLDSSQDNSA